MVYHLMANNEIAVKKWFSVRTPTDTLVDMLIEKSLLGKWDHIFCKLTHKHNHTY